ncbi:MAG: DUF4065 domain-containing protein [Bacilli bacterium]
MYYHFILMVSDYDKGARKAYCQTFSDTKRMREFRSKIKKIKGDFKNVTFSTHQLMTESKDIKSVVEYDKYFENVIFYSDEFEFEKELKDITRITPSDILKYILTQDIEEATKLKVMKLIYFVYEEYLKITGKYLFEEEFETFRLGPVERSSYNRLSKYKDEEIELEDIDIEKVKLSLKLERLDEREEIELAVEKAMKRYGRKKASTLVNLTHQKGTPWTDIKETLGEFQIIPREIIKDYICN